MPRYRLSPEVEKPGMGIGNGNWNIGMRMMRRALNGLRESGIRIAGERIFNYTSMNAYRFPSKKKKKKIINPFYFSLHSILPFFPPLSLFSLLLIRILILLSFAVCGNPI